MLSRLCLYFQEMEETNLQLSKETANVDTEKSPQLLKRNAILFYKHKTMDCLFYYLRGLAFLFCQEDFKVKMSVCLMPL